MRGIASGPGFFFALIRVLFALIRVQTHLCRRGLQNQSFSNLVPTKKPGNAELFFAIEPMAYKRSSRNVILNCLRSDAMNVATALLPPICTTCCCSCRRWSGWISFRSPSLTLFTTNTA